MTAPIYRLCCMCGDRASFVVEPVGRYDWAGWADEPVCAGCLPSVVGPRLDELDRVQVRHVETPSLPTPTPCEVCGSLVGDADACCLDCEREIFAAIKSPGAAS